MKNFNKVASFSVAALILVTVAQTSSAHTRFNTSSETEGVRDINHIVIGHSCNETSRTIGTSVVFPDGVDSTVMVNGESSDKNVIDYLTNFGNNASLILDRSAFDAMDEKIVDGNAVGFWAGGGPGMPNNLAVATPIRLRAASIEPTSCATSVAIKVSIADICEITSTDGFNDDVVRLWTHNDLGTPFDRVSDTDNGPATFTINRNLTDNPLPESCNGAGEEITIKPSAAQINRDMPIIINGSQIWPAP